MQMPSCSCLYELTELFHIARPSFCGFMCGNLKTLTDKLCCNTNLPLSAHPTCPLQ